MNRRRFLTLCGAGITAAALHARAQHARPNILILHTDDQSYETIHALGFDALRTPNMDRLVRRGTAFTNAYNPGGWHGAICVASRTMMLTGRFLWDAQRLEARLDDEAEAGRLWPQYLAEAGYETYFTGKWHVQTRPEPLFDHVSTVQPGMPPGSMQLVPEAYHRPAPGNPWTPSDPQWRGYWEGGTHWSEVVADEANGMLADAAGREKPFFIYASFNAPHDPRQSPQAYLDMYPPDEVAVPANYLPEYPHKEAMGAPPSLRDEALAPFPRTEEAVRIHRSEYYAIITHLDAQIGRILDELDASGQAENTVVILTSDQGLSVGHHGLMGKQNMFEHSMRVPLVIAGPGIPAGKRIDAPVYLQDIVPTTLELAGIEPPAHMDFKSLLPLIAGAREQQYDAIYGAYMDKQRMVRQGRYKLITYPEADVTLLFDLEADPHEMHNLADDPQHADKLAELRQTLERLQRETGDPLAEEE